MVRRSATVAAAPLRVCFPGGAVEVGESQESAVVREMREELSLDVRPVRQVWRWDSPDAPLTLFGWIADADAPVAAPDPAEIAEVLWLTPEEGAGHPDGLPTNAGFLECLVAALT